MLDGDLDGLLYPIPFSIVPDGDGWHSLIEADHERVHCDADRDDAEARRVQVGQAERKDQGVRDHEHAVAGCFDLILGDLDELQRSLKTQTEGEHPSAADCESRELREASERDHNHQERGNNCEQQEPHESNASEAIRRGIGIAYDAPVSELEYVAAGSIARITINRPERRNAMSFGVMQGLRDSLASARSDDAVRVVVLTGAGDRAFCSGADLTGMHGADGVAAHEGRGLLAGVFRDLWNLGKPTIARVRGYALAGGFGLAMACDFVVAADDAQFGAPEVNVGLWPYMVTVPLLRVVQPRIAFELMATGRRVGAEEASALGIVNRVVPVDQLDTAVNELADTLASKSPLAMRWGRQSFYRTLEMRGDEALDYLQAMLSLTAGSEDAAEGIAAFAEKRDPIWKGR